MRAHYRIWMSLGCLMAFASAVDAAPPSISSLQPRGAQRGGSIILVVEGAGLSADVELITGLAAEPRLITDDDQLKPSANRVAFRVSILDTEAAGPRLIRVRTPEGISAPSVFCVAVLPEVEEKEPNDLPGVAQPITLPATVNGRLSPTDRDVFRCSAKQGERLVFEAAARRIGSAVDPTLRLLSPEGRELALGEDSSGLDVDARIDFVAPATGEYLIQIHDATYSARAPDFYRLRAGSVPYAETVFPLGGRAGTDVVVQFDGAGLEAPVRSSIRLDEGLTSGRTYVSPPPGLEAAGGMPFLFGVGVLPEEIEGRREKGEPLPLRPPVTMNGRLEAAGEADRYALDVAAGQSWSIVVDAASLGSWCDPTVTVLKEDGGAIAAADDDGMNPDPRLAFSVPEGVRRAIIEVRDLLGRGGRGFAYRLKVEPQRPDFELRLGSTELQLPVRGTAVLEVECVRRGYGGPVTLAVTPPPIGFTIRGGEILPDQTKGYLTLTGPETGQPRRLSFRVTGAGGTAERPIERVAEGTLFLAKDQNVPIGKMLAAGVESAVVVPPPLSLSVGSQEIEVVVGHSIQVPIGLLRGANAGSEVKVTALAAPPGLTVAESKLAGDKAAGTVTLSAAPDAALRDGDVILVGVLGGKGAEVAAPSPAFRARVVRPFSAELSAVAVSAAAGSTAAIRGKIARTTPFAGKVQLKVEGLPAGMSATAAEVPPEKSEFEVDVAIPPAQPAGPVGISLVLSTQLGDPQKPVVHSLPGLAVALTVTAAAAAPTNAAAPAAKPAAPPP